jgi:hypothetical protein
MEMAVQMQLVLIPIEDEGLRYDIVVGPSMLESALHVDGMMVIGYCRIEISVLAAKATGCHRHVSRRMLSFLMTTNTSKIPKVDLDNGICRSLL